MVGRPPKCRQVAFVPEVTLFKPAGTPACNLEEVQLSFEELEALRLKDLLGLEQEECAAHMQVSRPTLQRILVTAREKVARTLIEGKALRIAGGTYRLSRRKRWCATCREEIEPALPQSENGGGEGEEEGRGEATATRPQLVCPRCEHPLPEPVVAPEAVKSQPEKQTRGHGQARRHGFGRGRR